MSGWPMVKLGEICTINPRRDKSVDYRTEISFIEMKSLLENGSVYPTITHAEKYLKGYTPFKHRDILVAKITPCFQNGKIGIANLATEFGFGTTEFHILRTKEDLLPEYLTAFLRQRHVLLAGEKQMTGSGGQRRVPKAFLEQLNIPLPSLGEQKRIAEILGNIQNAIELTSLQLDDISSSMKIESWTLTRDSPQTQLSHYIKKITSGKSLKEGNWENFQNCILKISAVTTGFFDDSEIKPLPASYTPQASHKVNTGDILLSRANTTELVGASAIVENATNNLYLPDKLWKLHIKDDVDTYFFWHLLQTKPVRSSISKASSGSGGSMKNISQKSFLNITVPKISREVQNQIGKNIRLQHILRSLLIKKLNLLQELQRSLSVRAFAGEL